MKTIISVALLLTIIPNDVRLEWIPVTLRKLAQNGEIIDGIFKPMPGGLLGSGAFGVTWKAQFIPRNNMEVAVKFTLLQAQDSAKNEFQMYTYLGAIEPNVEIYGIPSIYYYGKYYGEFNNYTMMAMTLLDPKFQRDLEEEVITELDLLIACREYVRIIKYIHSRGIIHFDSKIENIIVENGRGFIYDFGISTEMTGRSLGWNIANAKDDFKKFLKSMFRVFELDSNWSWLGLSAKDANRMKNQSTFTNELVKDAKTKGKTFRGLRKVFVEFARHAFDSHSTSVKDSNGNLVSFYDHLYQVICGEMGATSAMTSISSIPDPFGPIDWTRPPVNDKLFENRYADLILAARLAKQRI